MQFSFILGSTKHFLYMHIFLNQYLQYVTSEVHLYPVRLMYGVTAFLLIEGPGLCLKSFKRWKVLEMLQLRKQHQVKPLRAHVAFFFSFLVYACLYIFPGACAADVKSHFPCLDKAVSQHFSTQTTICDSRSHSHIFHVPNINFCVADTFWFFSITDFPTTKNIRLNKK